MKRLISLFSIALTFVICVLPLQAKTVKWIVLPHYDKIDQYGDIYMVQHDGITELMDITGKIINNSRCQSVTPWLSNGFSLLLDYIGDQEATLVGIYNCKSHTVMPTKDGQYKVRTDYAFFSDDRLPVKDTQKGKWGYMGIDGNIAIACQYDNAYPFSDKCAPVKTSDKVYKYINSNGDLAFRVTVGEGKIKSATPFFSNGTAYVLYDGGRKIAKISRRGEKVSNSDKREWEELQQDWLSDYKKNHENEPSGQGLKALDIGQVEKDQSEVFNAPNGQAIIRAKDGKKGILQRIDGDFSLGEPSVSKGKNKKQQHVTIRLDIPDGLTSDDLTFEINKGDGVIHEVAATDCQISNDKRTINFDFAQSSKVSLKNISLGIVVKHHGLILFSKYDIKPKNQDDDPEPIPVEKCTYCGQKKHDWKHPICNECGYMTGNVLPNYKCEANGHHKNHCKDRRCQKLIIRRYKPKYENNRCPVNGGRHGEPK